MITVPLTHSRVATPSRLLFGPIEQNKYLWKNLIIDKTNQKTRVSKFYEIGVVKAFWVVLTSQVK